MLLLVDSPQSLLENATTYFRTTRFRSQRDNQCRYILNNQRCPIGNVLHPQSEMERAWLVECTKPADYVLYGWFGISPFTIFSRLAMDLQRLHDPYDHWGQEGFLKLGDLHWLALHYKLEPTVERPPLPELQRKDQK